MELNLKVVRARVLRSKLGGTDKIIIEFIGPPCYPKWLPNENPVLSIDVARNSAEAMVREILGTEPEIIEI